ncbi:unnamed protein product [Paramecium primaurelia]|uniref:PH domain-containing protein n=1 Tax=Paramecium primaurelia TaxID=5886 RepID=A0A8S1N915_PARPR|nr:unnamed protein product [Paramecium primaurelia]
MDSKYQQALQLEGYIEKKSPSKLKGFQKRHFAVRDKGQYLVYSKKKILSKDVKPKGVIPIESIKSIAIIKGSEREFVLELKERQMLLRAESSSARELWTSTIAYLQEKLLNQQNSGSVQDSKSSFHSKGSESLKLSQKAFWKDIDSETKASIMIDKEKQQTQDKFQENEIKNEEVMVSKGLYAYLDKFDSQKFAQFVKCGFLYKKGKIASLTKAKRRWFIIISSISLLGDDAQIQGPSQSDLPDPFKLDHIYYFAYDFRNDQSSFKGELKANQIEDYGLMNVDRNLAFLKQFSHSVTYGFKFRHKERQYHFFSESLEEIRSWVTTIRIIKEYKATLTPQQIENEDQDLGMKLEDVLLQEKLEVKISRRIRKDKWFKRIVYLKKDSLIWAQQEKNDSENYILLISIKNVIGKENDFHIYTKDEKTFKFRTTSSEIRDEWIKKIDFLLLNLKGEFKDLEKVTELPPEHIPKSQSIEQKKSQSIEKHKIQPEDIEEKTNNSQDIASYYDNFFKQKKQQEQQDKQKKKSQSSGNSIFHKIFCCYSQDSETDRGF